MHPLLRSLTVLTLVIALTGCEGFKFLTIYNRTGQPIRIQTRAQQDSSEIIVLADRSYLLVHTFEGLLFNVKIKEYDLPVDYLKILTPTDTILARNRSEILRLIKDEKTRYHRKTDQSFAYSNHRNMEAIIVRR